MPTTRKRPGTPTAGMQLRQRWAPIVATGQVTCRRCGKQIKPGDPWDLGHAIDQPYALVGTNADPNSLAPECRSCNRSGYYQPQPETFKW